MYPIMIVIVDSGSTKADWEIIHDDGKKELVTTMGFNPYFVDEDRIEKELKKDFVKKVKVDAVDKVYFYGAGCSDVEKNAIVQRGLARIFTNASLIEVDHDLLACARAVCGTQPGIACIIGTGSNTCLYDGKKVIDNVANLGFLLGDEGSGSHLGKLLIQAYFYRELPKDIEVLFEKEYGNNKVDISNHIYGKSPNVYLASFAKFFSQNKNHFYIQKLVSDAFDALITRHILKYKDCHNMPINFIGSIAYHFQDILKMALQEHDLKLGIVVQKPIDNLVEFHLKNIDTL